jgi:ribosomal protein L37AE/L43A
MPFKPKAQKKIIKTEKKNITLDEKHTEIMNKFDKRLDKLPKLNNQIKNLSEKLKKTNNIDVIIKINDKINNIKKEIQIIKREKKKYLFKNVDCIFEFYEKKKKTARGNNFKVSLDSFFNTKKDNITNTNNTNNNSVDKTKIYLSQLDDSFIDIDDYIEKTQFNCEKCNDELIPIEHEGIMVCKNCSAQYKYIVEHKKPSYKEPPKEASFYAYKRINHFKEILAQFQAKETTQIDDSVIIKIKNQIKKERITVDELNNEKTKMILKNLGFNKYYEHIPFIKQKLGIKPPTMSKDLEEKLCNLFMQIQKPYAQFCPNDRVNFLNYYYVLFKLCELLNEDKYLKHFYMLKDSEKRIEQDEIWKKICNELNWEFIYTP